MKNNFQKVLIITKTNEKNITKWHEKQMTLPPEQKLTTAALKPVDPPLHLTLSLLTNIPTVAPASVSPLQLLLLLSIAFLNLYSAPSHLNRMLLFVLFLYPLAVITPLDHFVLWLLIPLAL